MQLQQPHSSSARQEWGMEKNIGAFEARRKFGQLIEEAFYNKDAFIVQRSGRPMAVIISFDEYQKWRALVKERLFQMVDEVWQRTQPTPGAELEAEVEEAVATLRAEQAEQQPA
jgi:prevent-host-death family protein